MCGYFTLSLKHSNTSHFSVYNQHTNMSSTLNIIPVAPPADEAALLTKPGQTKKTNLKGLVAGAGAASFVLGLIAATAVTSSAPHAPTALSSHRAPAALSSHRAPAALSSHHSTGVQLKKGGKCVAVHDHGNLLKESLLTMAPCKAYGEAEDATQLWDVHSDQIKLHGTNFCIDGLGGMFFMSDDSAHKNHHKFGLYDCKNPGDHDYSNQAFRFSGSSIISKFSIGEGEACMDTAGSDVIGKKNYGRGTCASWQRVGSGGAPPTPAPPSPGPRPTMRPTPRPVTPTGGSKKNGASCGGDHDCESDDCHGTTEDKARGKGKCQAHKPPTGQRGALCSGDYQCISNKCGHEFTRPKKCN